MVHIIWNECGSQSSADFLSNCQLIINQWLVYKGHTVGVQDCITSNHTIAQIRHAINKHQRDVKNFIHMAQIGTLEQQPGKNMIESFEAVVNQALNAARDESG